MIKFLLEDKIWSHSQRWNIIFAAATLVCLKVNLRYVFLNWTVQQRCLFGLGVLIYRYHPILIRINKYICKINRGSAVYIKLISRQDNRGIFCKLIIWCAPILKSLGPRVRTPKYVSLNLEYSVLRKASWLWSSHSRSSQGFYRELESKTVTAELCTAVCLPTGLTQLGRNSTWTQVCVCVCECLSSGVLL